MPGFSEHTALRQSFKEALAGPQDVKKKITHHAFQNDFQTTVDHRYNLNILCDYSSPLALIIHLSPWSLIMLFTVVFCHFLKAICGPGNTLLGFISVGGQWSAPQCCI